MKLETWPLRVNWNWIVCPHATSSRCWAWTTTRSLGASFLNDLRMLASWNWLAKGGFASTHRSKSAKAPGPFTSFHSQVQKLRRVLLASQCLRNWPLVSCRLAVLPVQFQLVFRGPASSKYVQSFELCIYCILEVENMGISWKIGVSKQPCWQYLRRGLLLNSEKQQQGKIVGFRQISIKLCSLTHERYDCDFENNLDKSQFWIVQVWIKQDPPVRMYDCWCSCTLRWNCTRSLLDFAACCTSETGCCTFTPEMVISIQCYDVSCIGTRQWYLWIHHTRFGGLRHVKISAVLNDFRFVFHAGQERLSLLIMGTCPSFLFWNHWKLGWDQKLGLICFYRKCLPPGTAVC